MTCVITFFVFCPYYFIHPLGAFANGFNRIQRQIDKPIFFFEISHGSTDGYLRYEFFVIGFQTFGFQIGLRLYFNGNNLLACVYNEICVNNNIFYDE